jgi:hypothetical protein
MKAYIAILLRVALIAGLTPIVAGCSTLGQTSSASVAPQSSQAAIRLQRPATSASGSYMAPNAKSRQLLYAPDFFANTVDVYSYPAGTFVGKLTGFNGPAGACVDKAQNVWITDQGSKQIVEYAHGGVTPTAILTDPGQNPISCAVDPKSGNLAVTNQTGYDHQGTVAIYEHASGSPQLYNDSRNIYWFYYCAYDASGDLFVDGTQFPYSFPVGQFQYAELPEGTSTFTNLTLQPSKTIKWAGGIQWDGAYMTLANPDKGVIYRLSGGTVVSTVRLHNGRGITNVAFDNGQVIAGRDHDTTANAWSYPGGGHIVTTLTLSKRHNPVAEVVLSK